MQSEGNRLQLFESVGWILMKHEIKQHQVFIWDDICFSTEIRHLHFNEMVYWFCNTTHGNNAIPEKTCHCIISYCFIWEDMSKTWASCFITGSKLGLQLVFSSVLFLGVWNPLMKHFLGILLTSLWSGILFLCQTISFVFWGRWFFSHFRSTGTFIVVCLYFEGTCTHKVMLIFQNRVFHMPIRKLQHVRLNCNKQKEYGEIDKVCLFWFIDCPK